MLKEFFSGLKPKTFPKFNTILFILCRFLSTIILITTKFSNENIKPFLLILIHLAHFIFLVKVRPFLLMKETIIETLHLGGFIMSIVILLFLDSEKDWKGGKDSIYIGVLMLGPFIGILIVMGDTVYQSIRKVCKTSRKDENESKERIINSLIKTYNIKI